MSEADLAVAIRTAVAAHPEGADAGPKALLAAVQAEDPAFQAVGIQKFKKALTKVKAALKEEEQQALLEAQKPKVGSKDNCPGRHGLTRFITNHSSYCCDTCRCYLPQGAPMWGCRICDWDVCEGRCHPATMTLEDFKNSISGLEARIEALVQEKVEDLKTALALEEAKVHKLEKLLDCATAKELAEASPLKMEEDEARAAKKDLLSRTEKLLARLEAIFEGIKGG
mmetsp:Transcript_99487/g.276854  ORF Transcript_99487/g.276854 Transcript_99487/m.276854 type:complete len:226 (+) Transcript_99487:146-823(+)